MPRVVVWLTLALALHARGYALELPDSLEHPQQLIKDTALPGGAGIKNLPVYPERLVYGVSWGILSVGQATLSVEKIVSFAGRPAYAISSTADSNSFCDAFHKVRDHNESWIDAQTLTSLGYSKKLREGNFFRDEWVVFDSQKYVFLSRTIERDGSFKISRGTIPAAVQDILSSLYYVRGHPLSEGDSIILDVNTKQNWPLLVRAGPRKKITTPAGTFQTIVVEPMLRQEGIFIQKRKRMRVWLTDDDRRIPVRISVEVFFGHITANLEKML